METHTSQAQFSGDYWSLDRPRWAVFFEMITEALLGKRVEIEVAGLDLGDQIEAERVVLDGVTYDRADDTLYVYAADAATQLTHAIVHPREILIGSRSGIVDRILVKDAEDHLHIVTLRDPLALPAPE